MKSERLPYKQIKELQRDYLMGMPKKELAEKYDIFPQAINSYLKVSEQTRTEIEKQMLTIPIMRETAKVIELKDELLDTIKGTLASYNTLEPALQVKNAHVITDIISTIDKIQRLNQEKPTDIQKNDNKTTYIDVAETIRALKAPDMSREDQIKFAQERLQTNITNHSK